MTSNSAPAMKSPLRPHYLYRLLAIAIKFLAVLVAMSAVITATAQAQSIDEYAPKPGDVIRVTVFGHDDLSGEFEVDAAGNISMSLINEVTVTGRTARAIETAIIDKLKPDYLRNPKVTVDIVSFTPVIVIGEVNDPGSYDFKTGMTAIAAIATAGGFTYRADKKKLFLKRDENGEEIVVTQETKLLPGDVIRVKARLF